MSLNRMNNRQLDIIPAKKHDIFKFIVVLEIVLLLAVIFTVPLWLPAIGSFLVVRDNIQKADCIVPLGGDVYFRFNKAIELYNKGYSRNIVVSLLPERSKNDVDYTSVVLRIYGLKQAPRREFALMAFKYLGKDSSDIYFTDKEVTSTYEEAIATKDFMLKNGFDSLIVVTSVYHMRRALMLFKSVFRGSGIKIYNCAAGGELKDPQQWYLKEDKVKKVMQEYLSMVHNFIYHMLLKKTRTSFDTY